MTLPFRRRHHDHEASHDRARQIWTTAMLESLDPADEGWLDRHLASCPECRLDRERYAADRELLRALRSAPPAPPRDLWARTAAAIEGERDGRAARGTRAGQGLGLPFRRMPVGAASGLLVVLVVIGAALVSRQNVIVPPFQTPGPTGVTPSVEPAATPLLVTAADVFWLRVGIDGSYEVVVADVAEVCPGERSGCPNLEQTVQAPMKLGGRPVGVTISPEGREMVVISAAADGQPARIVVVPVPEATPAPSATVPPTPTVPISPTPESTTPPPTDPPTIAPTDPPTGAPTEPGPEPTPEGAREIATDVVVVGDALYSPDGQWLAFSARPSDRSSGPDLYLWRTGTDTAFAVTDDHRTYFSSWLGGQIVASRVEIDAPPADASAPPSAEPTPAAVDEPSASAVGEASPEPAIEGRPISFLLDPETLAVTELEEPDVWLPVIDPTSRLVVYWSGTVAPSADGSDWQPAIGRVVLDRWTGIAGVATESPAPSAEPTEPAETEPGSSEPVEPLESVGPIGEPVVLAEGPIAAFDARFDPEGRRLGLWTLERADSEHGRLQLIVVDPDLGSIDQDIKPLEGVPALRGFSINEGRLAWVTPPGQDGRQSSVQVLAWKDRDFGHVETIPAQELLVLR